MSSLLYCNWYRCAWEGDVGPVEGVLDKQGEVVRRASPLGSVGRFYGHMTHQGSSDELNISEN